MSRLFDKPLETLNIVIADTEARKKEYCACASCKHNGICKYNSKFIEFQQSHFPAKIDCYKYERNVEND